MRQMVSSMISRPVALPQLGGPGRTGPSHREELDVKRVDLPIGRAAAATAGSSVDSPSARSLGASTTRDHSCASRAYLDRCVERDIANVEEQHAQREAEQQVAAGRERTNGQTVLQQNGALVESDLNVTQHVRTSESEEPPAQVGRDCTRRHAWTLAGRRAGALREESHWRGPGIRVDVVAS